MLNNDFYKHITKILSGAILQEVELLNISSVAGGSINGTYQLTTNRGNFFIKKNQAVRYPELFEKEALGLELLRGAQVIRIPNEFAVGEFQGDSFLILEYIQSSSPQNNFWEQFGAQMAKLHQHTSEQFGLDHNNYIGSLNQQNSQYDEWVNFFIHERLEPQVELAKRNNQIDNLTINQFEKLFERLNEIFPQEKPSLLHGDLWSGNFMVDEKGMPVIMDPAVYFGHREMDIAMTQLFGGFDASFYDSYNAIFPLQKGWKDRIEICNLYPLMVHVNLFGGSYLSQVKQVLMKF